jgi:iron complex transport system permease protein
VSVPLALADRHAPAGDRRRRGRIALALLAALLLVVGIASLGIGPLALPPAEVLAVLAQRLGIDIGAVAPQSALVVLEIRMPRTLTGMLVGAALAVSGAVLQGLFRNPLADPALIGVSSGSALAVVSTIVLGHGVLAPIVLPLGLFALPVAGLGGALAATLLLYAIATRQGSTSVAVLLLAGIAVAALAAAATGFLIFTSTDAELRDITFWSLGSLGGSTWPKLGAAAVFILGGLAALPFLARGLDALLLGESEAFHLGIEVQRLKRIAIAAVAAATGAAVAVSGVIGFVGIVVAHLLRLSLGPSHRILLPGAALLGAAMMVLSDMVARTIVAPAELPIGILTALVGAPFFLWLLLRRHAAGEGPGA